MVPVGIWLAQRHTEAFVGNDVSANLAPRYHERQQEVDRGLPVHHADREEPATCARGFQEEKALDG